MVANISSPVGDDDLRCCVVESSLLRDKSAIDRSSIGLLSSSYDSINVGMYDMLLSAAESPSSSIHVDANAPISMDTVYRLRRNHNNEMYH